jgi:hypothetical protein
VKRIFLLVICPVCEQVICFECIHQHQLVVNNDVQQNWAKCKETWNLIYEKSSNLFVFPSSEKICFRFKVLFDEKQFNLESHMYELKTRIEKRSNFLLEMIENWRQLYENKINRYSETFDVIRKEITTQFQTIDQHIQTYLRFIRTIVYSILYSFI